MTRTEAALAATRDEFSCAQAVFATFAREMGMDHDLALRAAGALGGGAARMGETCGAVSGALMAVGLRHGMTRAHDSAQKDRAYAEGRAFIDAFLRRFQALRCKDLLGVDISEPGALKRAAEAKVFDAKCPLFVAAAVEILEAMGYPEDEPGSPSR